MKSKLLTLMALALTLTVPANAQADEKDEPVFLITVQPLTGSAFADARAKIAKIEVANGEVRVIAKADGSVLYTLPKTKTSKIIIGGYGYPSTALRTVEATESLASIIAEPGTKSVRVVGIKDGAPVLVYDLSGKLLLKGAAPGVSLESLSAGFYLVVAGDAAAKVTVK